MSTPTPIPAAGWKQPPTVPPKPKGGTFRTVMKWIIVAWNLVMGAWIVAGLSSASGNCAGEVGDALEACEAGTAIGAGLAIILLMLLWALVDVILLVLFLVAKPKPDAA
jgi:hypothetical protein